MDVMQNTMLPLQQRPTELGRIRLGDKSVTAKGKEYPVKLETWRLTSGSRDYLEAAAALYGGDVQPWADAPDEGMWELLTESATLKVLIPRDLRTLTQSYELWQGGTCERRCDGTYEQISGGDCLCDPSDRDCSPRTRLSIMLPDVPGLGVWRLETSGYHAATSLPATIELLKSLSERPWIPAVLRLEQRSKKSRDGDGKVQTHRFAVPVLDLPGITIGKVVARMGNGDAPAVPQIAAQAPVTARERVAQQRAAIEATTQAAPDWQEQAPDEPPADAGARTDTPDLDPGNAAAGNPTPAPSPDSGAAPLAPESGAPPGRCEGFSIELGACVREPDHSLNHRNKTGETWK